MNTQSFSTRSKVQGWFASQFRNQPVGFWFFVALTIRVAATLGLFGISKRWGYDGYLPIQSMKDDRYYVETANRLLNGMTGREVLNPFPLMLAPALFVGRGSVLAAALFCALIGALGVSAWCRVIGLLGHRQSAEFWPVTHVVGLTLSCMPMSIYLSSGALKDGSVLLFSAIVILSGLKLGEEHQAKREVWTWWVALGGSAAMLFSLRVYAAPPVLGAALLLALLRKRSRGGHVWKSVVGLIGCLCLWLLVSARADLRWFDSDVLRRGLDFSSLRALREQSYSGGGSDVGIAIEGSRFSQFRGVLWSTLTAMFGPFPGQVTSKQLAVISIDTVSRLLALAMIWRFRPTLKMDFAAKKFRGLSLTFAGAALAVALVIGTVSNNAGASARLRETPFVLFVVAIAFWPRSRFASNLKAQHRKRTRGSFAE